MKRSITKFVNNIFGKKQEEKSTMDVARYFPNTAAEYNHALPKIVEIPGKHLIDEINIMVENIRTNLKPMELNGEDGLYLGTAGVAYMFYHLSKVPTLHEQRSAFLNDASEYIKPSLAISQKYANRKNDVPSFILGNCGVYAIAAAIYNNTGDIERRDFFRKLYYDAAYTCKDLRFLDCGSDELFVGRAGYICGALWLAKETNTSLQIDDLHEISRVMIASGREYSLRHQSPSPLMYAYYDVEYFGAAHGLCSILQILLSVPSYLDANPLDAKDVKASVDYLLSLQDTNGNFPSATDDIHDRHELLHWCHGAPGIVYLMAKAYLSWHEEKYLQSCEIMANLIWKQGLLKKGPGLCHGIGGNAYVFLLLFRITNNQMYLHRAIAFARFMETEDFKKYSRVPDNPFSLYEGIAGTVCFLADLTAPEQAAFPFSDVFA